MISCILIKLVKYIFLEFSPKTSLSLSLFLSLFVLIFAIVVHSSKLQIFHGIRAKINGFNNTNWHSTICAHTTPTPIHTTSIPSTSTPSISTPSPLLLLSNMSNLISIKLDYTNYIPWKHQLITILEGLLHQHQL